MTRRVLLDTNLLIGALDTKIHVATAKCNKLEIRSNDKDIKKLEQLFLDCDIY